MALSRKHQAVHDILTQTTVQLSASAGPHEDSYHLERLEPSDVTLPSRGRLGAILIYLVAAFVGYGMALTAIDPAGCAQTGSCIDGLEVATGGLALLWLGLSIAIVVVGWKGLLFGARRARHLSPNPLSPDER
jgi:hypothetical protein